jgi:hypothetical protein
MSDKHHPIDSKDDTSNYRAQVWNAVRQRIGAELTPLPCNATFNGTWDVEFDMFGSRMPMFRYDFHSDGHVMIVALMGADQSPEREQYTVREEGRMEIAGETYHAASTEDGRVIFFNGDQSLVLVGSKR